MYNKLPSVVDYQILNCDHNALVPYCYCVIFANILPSSITVFSYSYMKCKLVPIPEMYSQTLFS